MMRPIAKNYLSYILSGFLITFYLNFHCYCEYQFRRSRNIGQVTRQEAAREIIQQNRSFSITRYSGGMFANYNLCMTNIKSECILLLSDHPLIYSNIDFWFF